MNKRSKDTPQPRAPFFHFLSLPLLSGPEDLRAQWREHFTLCEPLYCLQGCPASGVGLESWGAPSLGFLHFGIKHRLTKVPSTLGAKHLAVENLRFSISKPGDENQCQLQALGLGRCHAFSCWKIHQEKGFIRAGNTILLKGCQNMETPECPGPVQAPPRLQKDAYEGAQATRAVQGLQVIPTCSQGENHWLHREMAIPGESRLLAFKELVHFIWVIEFTGTELFTLLNSLILLLTSRASVEMILSFLF